MMAHHNPFIYGNPVAPEQLIGRNKELRQIAGRINTGQSTIITGSPRSGKTSMLYSFMVASGEERAKADKLIFSYWDACTCGSEFDQTQFWNRVLRPLKERIIAQGTDTPLSKAYQTCQENQFETDDLEKLIAQLKQANWRLVLLIDEFDSLLEQPLLKKNNGEFFANLRTLVTSLESGGALVLLVASFFSQRRLNQETPQSRNGSPYFNFLEEIVLGALPNLEIDKLLHQGDAHFMGKDYCFIKEIAGGHPYLLQLAASILWEIYEDGNEKKLCKRQQETRQNFSFKAVETLDRIWKSWSLPMQKAFTSVIPVQTKEVKKDFLKQGIDVQNLIDQIPHFNSELNKLEKYGFLVNDNNITGGWRVYPSVFLSFMPDKLRQELLHVDELRKGGNFSSESGMENFLEADEPRKGENFASENWIKELVKKLLSPKFFILMMIGIIIGERIGEIFTNEELWMLAIFSGLESLSIYIVKFAFAALCALIGYEIAYRLEK